MERAVLVSRRLKLRHLNALLAVVERGSMAKAAVSLSVSQPVISKAIAELEAIVGVQLLERGPRGVEPTIYGSALVKRSVAIFDDLRTSVGELESLADPTVGELRIGSSEAMSTGMLPAIIDLMGQQSPRVVFKIAMGDTAALVDRGLRGRNLDLVIGQRLTSLVEDDIESTVLYRDRLYVVAGAVSPWARRRKKIALADLVNERWCLPPSDHPVGKLLGDVLRSRNLPSLQNVVSVTSAPFTSRLVAGGRYLGILGSVFLEFNVPQAPLAKLPVDLPKLEQIHTIVTLKNRVPSPVMKRFIDCALEVGRTIEKRSRQ